MKQRKNKQGKRDGFFVKRSLASLLVLCICTLWSVCAMGEDVTVFDVWSEVKAPDPPELKPARVDSKTTVLLILDIEQRTTNMDRRPRAVASVPVIQKLLDRARQGGMSVIFSTTPNAPPEDILPEVAPRKGEPVVKSSVDKFFKTDLETLLRERGATSVIIVGTAAEGAVVHTATAAAMRGFDVIVPVDGLSSSSLYAEQYVCWHLVNAPGSRRSTTLTRTDLIHINPYSWIH